LSRDSPYTYDCVTFNDLFKMLHQTANAWKFVALIKKHIPKTTHSTNNNIHIMILMR
jgi:hypothetical protein